MPDATPVRHRACYQHRSVIAPQRIVVGSTPAVGFEPTPRFRGRGFKSARRGTEPGKRQGSYVASRKTCPPTHVIAPRSGPRLRAVGKGCRKRSAPASWRWSRPPRGARNSRDSPVKSERRHPLPPDCSSIPPKFVTVRIYAFSGTEPGKSGPCGAVLLVTIVLSTS